MTKKQSAKQQPEQKLPEELAGDDAGKVASVESDAETAPAKPPKKGSIVEGRVFYDGAK